VKLFDEHFDAADKPAWAIDAEHTLSGLFHYWIKNRPGRPSMNEYLVDTEIRWRLAEYRRAIYDRERKKANLLKEKIQDFIAELYVLKIKRGLSHEV
jgi:hypothetical protein